MSIITVEEIHALCPDARSDRDLYDFAAGITQAFERACNRVIARRVSNATAAEGVATAIIPRHGWRVGQEIRVAAINAASHWDGLTEVASVSGWDQITFEIDSELESETATEITIRPVREAVLQTRGTQSVFLDPRPLAEIISVELGKGDGTYETELDADTYALGDIVDGVSFTGELVLYDDTFPERLGNYRRGGYINAGARIKYISGEPIPPNDLIYGARRAMKTTWEQKDKKNSNLQSESYDYYSYSRMGADQLAGLFGELESIIKSHRIAVI